jgi:hypothetical protein
MNTFRLEWEPGENGYLRWYINGKFTFGIDQSSLNFMETNIPNEPSYIIINTAISTSWGFPPPPPGCSSYDCKNPAGRCGFNAGFCELLPAKFLIDHVRVYQDKTNELHTIGCNPPNYPTRRYIEAYKYNYKSIVDPEPLQKIVTGGASCRTNAHCGKGTCSAFHKCVCSHGWQGPTCRVSKFVSRFTFFKKNIYNSGANILQRLSRLGYTGNMATNVHGSYISLFFNSLWCCTFRSIYLGSCVRNI